MNVLLRFQLLQRILPGTQAYLFGVIHRVPPMTAFNALDQGFAVVSFISGSWGWASQSQSMDSLFITLIYRILSPK